MGYHLDSYCHIVHEGNSVTLEIHSLPSSPVTSPGSSCRPPHMPLRPSVQPSASSHLPGSNRPCDGPRSSPLLATSRSDTRAVPCPGGVRISTREQILALWYQFLSSPRRVHATRLGKKCASCPKNKPRHLANVQSPMLPDGLRHGHIRRDQHLDRPASGDSGACGIVCF